MPCEVLITFNVLKQFLINERINEQVQVVNVLARYQRADSQIDTMEKIVLSKTRLILK